MDALWTLLAVAATGVTYDWQPLDDGADGVEYIVQVEPELLQAAAAGDLQAIESNIPDNIGKVRRIRIVLGGGDSASDLAAANGKEHSVLKPATEPVDWPQNTRHTVRQSGTSGQPLSSFTQQLNNSAGQLEQGFQQASQGVQGGFQQANQAFAGAQNALTQPFATQPAATPPAPRRTIGSELLRGAGELRDGTRNVIRNTGEAIQGTAQNLRNGVRSVLTGGDPPAPAPAGSGGFNAFSYQNAAPVPGGQQGFVQQQTLPATNVAPPFAAGNQPAGNSGFANPVNSQPQGGQFNTQQGQGGGFQNQPSSFNTSDFNASGNPNFTDNGDLLSAPPLNAGNPSSRFASQPAGRQSGESTAPPAPPSRDDWLQGGGDDPSGASFVPLSDPRNNGSPSADQLTGQGLMPVRAPRNQNGNQPAPGFNNEGFGNQASSNQGFSNQSFGNDGFGNPDFANQNPQGGPQFPNLPSTGDGNFGGDQDAFAPWLPSNSTPQTNPQGGAAQFVGMPPLNQPMNQSALPPLDNPPMPTGQQQVQAQQAGFAGAPTTASKQPWQWFAALLVSFGSIAGNFFLGWSYLDARNKYQSALRRTVRSFTRSSEK